MTVSPVRQLELLTCLETLVREVVAGRVTGISYTATTPDGVVPGWAGQFSGRRLVDMGSRRIVAVDDDFAPSARRMGAER